ncbi:MAG: hypothetical protein EBY17_15635 [Acidobacteriia bacterium]|nr:hypothetical protein [Terriglobia bacterium]
MRVGLVLFVFIALSLFAKTWAVDGIVIAVDPLARTMLVSHRPIGNYMGAMAMPFRVASSEALKGLQPGDRVTFDLVVGKGKSLARSVKRTEAGPGSIPFPKERLRIGDPLPDFALTDQAGRAVRPSDLRGRVLAIDFIYTRCPLPDVCPRLSASFATVAKRLRGQAVTLLSITVDPEYDTPQILAEYAKRWGAAGLNWHFLTGDVAKLAGALGEVYWTDEGSIGHNSATAVFGRDGRVAATLEGSSWRADQLEKLILHQLENQK